MLIFAGFLFVGVKTKAGAGQVRAWNMASNVEYPPMEGHVVGGAEVGWGVAFDGWPGLNLLGSAWLCRCVCVCCPLDTCTKLTSRRPALCLSLGEMFRAPPQQRHRTPACPPYTLVL